MSVQPSATLASCLVRGCVAEHHDGQAEHVVDVAALPVVDPDEGAEPLVLVTAVVADGELLVDLDVDGRAARVRLADLVDAVAAAAAVRGDVAEAEQVAGARRHLERRAQLDG